MSDAQRPDEPSPEPPQESAAPPDPQAPPPAPEPPPEPAAASPESPPSSDSPPPGPPPSPWTAPPAEQAPYAAPPPGGYPPAQPPAGYQQPPPPPPGYPQQGAPPPGGYPQQGYPQQGYPQGGYAPPPGTYGAAPPPAAYENPERWGPLAHWGLRVGASLIDSLVALLGLVFLFVGIPFLVAGIPDRAYDPIIDDYVNVGEPNSGLIALGVTLMVIGLVAEIAIQLWNRVFRHGRTGQSVGKSVFNLMLIDERTGQPIGALMAFLREILHVLDGILYIGYLWPLWDPKRQTFADKIVNTVVIKVPPR